MYEALLPAALVLSVIALWCAVVFLMGWKEYRSYSRAPGDWWRSKLRRFWIFIFAACATALLVAVFIRTTVPRNPAIAEAARVAIQSQQVQDVLGNPIRTTGVSSGEYKGIGNGSRVSAGLRLKGSKQSGTLHACAIKHNNQWLLVYAEVIAEDHFAVLLTPLRRESCDQQ